MAHSSVYPYLYFGGRCEEALAFYQAAVGAQIEMVMHHRENPDPFPPGTLQSGFEEKVLHATFRIGDSLLMASDGFNDESAFAGFSLHVSLGTEAEVQRGFAALADGGSIQMPLTRTFWSPCFGMLTDRFGISWKVTLAS